MQLAEWNLNFSPIQKWHDCSYLLLECPDDITIFGAPHQTNLLIIGYLHHTAWCTRQLKGRSNTRVTSASFSIKIMRPKKMLNTSMIPLLNRCTLSNICDQAIQSHWGLGREQAAWDRILKSFNPLEFIWDTHQKLCFYFNINWSHWLHLGCVEVHMHTQAPTVGANEWFARFVSGGRATVSNSICSFTAHCKEGNGNKKPELLFSP